MKCLQMKNLATLLNSTKYLLFILIILSLFACKDDEVMIGDPEPAESSPNILLIIADDFGKDACNGFAEGSIKPNMPNIDAIRNEGLIRNEFTEIHKRSNR